jgi:predicted dehydrogenase
MKKIKVGAIGCGFIHNVYHMPAFRSIANVDVVAACAATKQEVQPFAERWGIGKQYYGDNGIEQLYADTEVDVEDIGLPNFLHLRATRAAAENHKHVICEKPLARDVNEAKEMLVIVKRYGVTHCYAENQVFSPKL